MRAPMSLALAGALALVATATNAQEIDWEKVDAVFNQEDR